MRILLAHNFYQHPGGEDRVFAAEATVMEKHGHTVIRMTRHHDQLLQMNRVALAGTSIWNRDVYKQVRRIVRQERVDIVHFHNTFPLISPSAYYAARAENVPVVQTLHNYRLLCPGSLFYREGRVCEDCLNRALPWPGVLHGCYRGSVLQTGALAGMTSLHRAAGTWSRIVTAYVALTEFARDKFIAGGLPASKICVKPNFLSSDPGGGNGQGAYALFVGRITDDKGIQVLMDAWRKLDFKLPLKIAGEGPLRADIARQASTRAHIEVLGAQSPTEIIRLMKSASILVVPSKWYEGFPITVVEAYACGLPVIASDLGSLSSVVANGSTGLLFRPGDAESLVNCISRLLSDPSQLAFMRRNARRAFEQFYGPVAGYSALIDLYESAKQQWAA